MEERFEGAGQENSDVAEWAGVAEGEREQTAETISSDVAQKIGGAARKAVDLDALREEVETEVKTNEDPHAGYEKWTEAKEEAGIIEEE